MRYLACMNELAAWPRIQTLDLCSLTVTWETDTISKQVNKCKNTPYVSLLGESQAQLRSQSGYL